jgi:flagellar L-ring protein precursor FlgH
LGLSGILNLTPSDFKTKTDYKGSQRTSRGGRIIAKVTAKVISVLENGYLQILGKKTIRINNREEVIEVSGVANPLDIAQDGSILSTKLIDAKIEYKGDLKFSHKERPGFFSRIISKIISILF